MSEAGYQQLRPGALDAGRTVLGWETGESIRGRQFKKAVLMGPYWSGTNAVRDEITWRFQVPVLNPDKLEMWAETQDELEAVRQRLGNNSLLRKEGISLGSKHVPRGYRLMDRTGTILKHRSYTARGQERRVGDNVDMAPDLVLEDSGYQEKPIQNQTQTLQQKPLRLPVRLCFSPDTAGACLWWKHSVRCPNQGEIDTGEDALVILVVKDLMFWLQSVSKHKYEIKLSDGQRRADLDSLFKELVHERRTYRDAVELWTAGMDAFLDDARYPSSRCVLLRYEDFLFRFWDVLVHLSAFLPCDCSRLKEPPNSNRSKHHGKDVRGRDQALWHYSSAERRVREFTQQHLERLHQVSPEILQALGYSGVPIGVAGQSGLCTWVPRLQAGDIVAACLRSGALTAAVTKGCKGEAAKDYGSPEGLLKDLSMAEAAPTDARFWARVIDGSAESCAELITVELLGEVPRSWFAASKHDWSCVEFPAMPQPASLKEIASPGHHVQIQRGWADLRLPNPACSSMAELPITEEGYRTAVNLRSTHMMAEFITRVIQDLEVNGERMGKVLHQRGLLCFARWFSGEAKVQSLMQIKRELPGKESERWVSFRAPQPMHYPVPPPLPERGYPAVRNFDEDRPCNGAQMAPPSRSIPSI